MAKEKSSSEKADEIIVEAWDESNSGKLDNAIAKAREALRQSPEDWHINASLGVFLRERGYFEEALQFCRQAVELAPEVSRTWENLAVNYFDQGNFENAVQYFAKSLELEERPSTYTLLASAKFSLDDLVGTIEACKRALELDPEWDEAEALLKKAQKELDPG